MISLTIPVYYTKKYKTKKDKTFLVSLNWFRNSFFHEQNEVKVHFSSLVEEALQDCEPITGKYEVTYRYFYKNKTSDLPNVTPMCSKWVNDTLQTNELISNDNVQYLVREIHEVAEQDRENPRCEITIKEIDE